jgi:uncharacterized protein
MKPNRIPSLLAAAFLTASIALAPAGAAEKQSGRGGYAIGDRLQSGSGKSSPGGSVTYRDAKWEELVPKDWDPMKDLRKLDLRTLDDADPRAGLLLDRMRELWDKAPVNAALEGAALRLPGFVVPLERSKAGLREFLLVPYFGACIHVPPPPANQIIHVYATKPLPGIHAMSAVWVSGILTIERANSVMGMSGYRMRASMVKPYEERTEVR